MSIFDNFKIQVNNKAINKSPLIDELFRNMMTFCQSDYNRNLFVHVGTNYNFVLTVTFASFKCFSYECSKPTDFLNNLNCGEIVVYEKKRYHFDHIDTERIYLVNDDKSTTSIGLKNAHLVNKYTGTAQKTSGKGIRSADIDKRATILSEIYEISIHEAKKRVDYSIVIVCEKQEADYFSQEVSLVTNGGKQAKLSELFPSAYYTNEENFISYSGNSAKAEPILKFTNKVSIARSLIIRDKGTSIIGLIVNGNSKMEYESELASLIMKRTLRNIVLIAEIYKFAIDIKSEEYADFNIIACTNRQIEKFKSDYSLDLKTDVFTKRVIRRMSIAVNQQIEFSIYKSDIDYIELRQIRKNLNYLMKLNENDIVIDEFLCIGYSLLKLIELSVFSIDLYEEHISNGIIGSASPKKQLQRLGEIVEMFGNEVNSIVLIQIMEGLIRNLNCLADNNKKGEKLIESISKLNLEREIVVVIPKMSYRACIIESAPIKIQDKLKKVVFVTPKKFSYDKDYDYALVVSLNSVDKFDIYSLYNVKNIEIIACEDELPLYKYLKKIRNNLEDKLDGNVTVVSESDLFPAEINQDFIGDELLSEFISSEKFRGMDYLVNQIYNTSQCTQVAKMVLFETDEVAFFTKTYSAYVVNFEKETVDEIKIDDVKIGDNLIFKEYDDHTKDIVEDILIKVVNADRINRLKETYEKANEWKIALKQYMSENELNYQELSNLLEAEGFKRHHTTIRSWLCEGSHIVGPREEDALYAIAKLTKHEDMKNNVTIFYEAINEIRSLRIKILKQIGTNIINSLAGKKVVNDSIFYSYVEDINEMIKVLQVQEIRDIELKSIPIYLANRPYERGV